jgi:hypothetical protein
MVKASPAAHRTDLARPTVIQHLADRRCDHACLLKTEVLVMKMPKRKFQQQICLSVFRRNRLFGFAKILRTSGRSHCAFRSALFSRTLLDGPPEPVIQRGIFRSVHCQSPVSGFVHLLGRKDAAGLEKKTARTARLKPSG